MTPKENTFQQQVDHIANQLCHAVDGRFDFRVQADTTDPIIEKLLLLINFMLDSMHRSINTLEQQSAELKKQVVLAEVATIAKANFLANMSHEIRTPLNGIVGLAGLLNHTPMSTHQADMLNGIRLSSDNLLAIINEVLDFSKIETGHIDLELLSFDLYAMTLEVAESLAVRAAQKNVELIVRYSPGSPKWVITDESRLRQVLINLLSNAIKFTEQGHVMINIHYMQPNFTIEIIDTGIGIASEHQQTLFDQFTQADASITRKFGGTGLGLAISRSVITALGGTIGVKGNPAGGSIFWIALPLVIDNEKHEALPMLSLAQQNPSVLIVDDNEVNRLVIHEQLLHWGVDAELLTSGAEALTRITESITQKKPIIDIALIDYSMPGMDGISLAQAIRKIQPNDMALVMISSINNTFTEEYLCQQGINGYLLKPSPEETLHAMLQVLCAGIAGEKIPPLITRHTLRDAKSEQHLTTAESIKGLRVLLAEDNIVNQKVAKALLEREGCIVYIANTGREALEQLLQFPVDLVFMDMQMPEMDGIEATLAIRRHKHRNLRQIPVIALTANATKEDQANCFAAGMNAFMTKPFRPEELSQKLQQWGKKEK